MTGCDANHVGREPVRDVVPVNVVGRPVAVAIHERHFRSAGGDVVEEVGEVRRHEHHLGAFRNELPEDARGVGGVRYVLDLEVARRRERRLDSFHPLVMRPGPALVSDGADMAKGDHRIFFLNGSDLRGGRGDQPRRQNQRSARGGG